MNLQEILNLTWKRLADEKGSDAKRNWQQWELVSYINEAEREVAVQLELLKDSDTIGYLTLTGVAGQIDSVSVSGIVVTSAAVAFATSLTATAAALAANINAYTSTPNYRSVSRGTLVIIKAMPGTGYPASGYSITSAASAGMTAAAVNLPGLCRHVLTAGQRFITLNDRILRIDRFKPSGQTRPLPVFTKADMDASFSGWETQAAGTIKHAIPDYENNEIIVSPPTAAAEMIEQDVLRLPLADLSEAVLAGIPEIPERYHKTMIEWVMRTAYRKNDVETLDLGRSLTHETEFHRQINEFRIQANRKSAVQRTNVTHMGVM